MPWYPSCFFRLIIENSIKYGYKHQESLSISIRGLYRSNRILFWRLMDDGYGHERGRLVEDQTYCEQIRDNQNTHIGLNNVHRRLVLLYGKDYGVRFES